jgi:hypothetical protein
MYCIANPAFLVSMSNEDRRDRHVWRSFFVPGTVTEWQNRCETEGGGLAMSEDDDKAEMKRRLLAGATMQIDLAQVQLVDIPPSAPALRSTKPPPLPADASVPPAAPDAPTSATHPPASMRVPAGSTAPAAVPPRTGAHIALVVVVVVLAIVAGLAVGRRMRGSVAAAPASGAASPSAPAASASQGNVLTLPPIEVR